MELNYDALDQPVTSQEIAAYKAIYPSGTMVMNASIVAFVVLIMIAGMFFIIGLFTLLFSVAIGIVFLLFTAMLGGGAVLVKRSEGVANASSVKLWKLAKANGLTYMAATPDPTYNGMMFSQGSSRIAYDQLFKVTANEAYEFGNYTYVTGSGKSSETHVLSYIGIVLERNLPQMVLDAEANNTHLFGADITNLPVYFKKDQALSLEGDFNKYFTLYAPKEYEADALYVFTPDLMALFIDEAASFDAEIVDNKLYVYSHTKLDFTNKLVLERIAAIVNIVGAKVMKQTQNYADANVGNRAQNVVAPAGQRLHQTIPIVTIVVSLLFFFGFLAVQVIVSHK